MPKFLFNWSLNGSTLIEAASVDEAQTIFDKRTTTKIVGDDGDSVLTQHEVCVETSVGIFEEVP